MTHSYSLHALPSPFEARLKISGHALAIEFPHPAFPGRLCIYGNSQWYSEGKPPGGFHALSPHARGRVSYQPSAGDRALLRLENEGLVESKPRVGTRVRIPTRQEVEDRSLLREALETQAARLFAERASPSQKSELRRMGRNVDRLYAACENGNADRDLLFSVNTCHMELHLWIAECASCPALRDAIEKEQVLVFNWLYDIAARRRVWERTTMPND